MLVISVVHNVYMFEKEASGRLGSEYISRFFVLSRESVSEDSLRLGVIWNIQVQYTVIGRVVIFASLAAGIQYAIA
jgi:hypothetical protein